MNKFVFILFVAFIVACSDEKESIKPIISDITESVYASGIVKSAQQYQVFPKGSGIIDHLFLQEGDLVKTNQVFISIFNENSRLSRENAALIASFNSLQNNNDKIREAKIAMDLAKAKLKTDSLNYVRQKNLVAKNVISESQFEQVSLQYENAKSSYSSAQIRYDELKKQLNLSDQQSKRNLLISQNTESDFLVKSEIDGKIYAILKEKGEMVNPQTPIAIVGSAHSFIIELQIDEEDISSVEIGQKVSVSLDSYKGQAYEAIVSKIHPYLNEKSKTFTVEATFVKAPKRLYPNLSLEANIVIAKKAKALLIPRNYLQDDDFVFLENGEKRKVKTGLKNLEFIEVISGLNASDALVLELP